MPEKSFIPPPLLLVLGAAVLGLIAQLGVHLALGIVRSRSRLAGFLLLSALVSGSVTLLALQLTAWDDYVCACLGALAGTAPPLLVLRAGILAATKRAGLDPAELLGAAPPTQTGWLGEQAPSSPITDPPQEVSKNA